MKPLQGVRVLDLTRLLPGGFCSRVLADFGAEVIKVEDAASPDPMRLGGELSLTVDGVPVLFAALHRGKRALAINLKDPRGRAAFLSLARSADVLLEGFRPGAMARLGLGYEDLHTEAPRLVYCSLSGYGQDGPYRERAGHDLNYQALVGTLSLGIERGADAAMPDLPWADLAGGAMTAAMGIVSNLYAARVSGQGTHVDAAMLDGMLLYGLRPTTEALTRGREPLRAENPYRGASACYNLYATKDGGFMSLAAVEPKFWRAFCELIQRPDMVPLQWERASQLRLKAELGQIFAAKNRDEWMELARGCDCCLEPVLAPGEALRHPQIAARNHLYAMRGIDGRISRVPGVPPGLIGLTAPSGEPQACPGWGEHSQQVLSEAGVPAAEVAALLAAGVIHAGVPQTNKKKERHELPAA